MKNYSIAMFAFLIIGLVAVNSVSAQITINIPKIPKIPKIKKPKVTTPETETELRLQPQQMKKRQARIRLRNKRAKMTRWIFV